MNFSYCVVIAVALHAAPLQGLQMADNLRGCFDQVESDTFLALNETNPSWLALFGQIEKGRDLINSCESSNPTNPSFAWCFAGQAEDLRLDSAQALGDVRRGLARLSRDMDRVVAAAVDCVSAQLSNVRGKLIFN